MRLFTFQQTYLKAEAMKKNRNINTVDLFAGGGGLSLGFIKAGYNVVAAFDNWEPAINLYKENFSNHPIIKCDLASSEAVSIIESFSPDFIMGGPPCQDFSSAGKRDEKLGRADLTIAFSKIISKIKPKYFLMENVDRALKSKAIKSAIETFKKSGYGLTVTVLNACYCGVPQSRKGYLSLESLGGG